MKHIRSIDYLENNVARVILDGYETLDLDTFAVSQSRIEPDSDVEDEIISRLIFETDCVKAKKLSMKLINAKMRTEKQLIKLLQEKGISLPAAEKAVEELKNWGAVNDEAYAVEFMRYRMANSKKSWRAVFYELKTEGVTAEDIRSAAESFDTDEEKRAEEVAENILRGRTDEASLKKLSGTLQRNGFYWEQIKHVLNKYSKENEYLE